MLEFRLIWHASVGFKLGILSFIHILSESPSSTRKTPATPPDATPEVVEDDIIVAQDEDTLQASVWNKPSNANKVKEW